VAEGDDGVGDGADPGEGDGLAFGDGEGLGESLSTSLSVSGSSEDEGVDPACVDAVPVPTSGSSSCELGREFLAVVCRAALAAHVTAEQWARLIWTAGPGMKSTGHATPRTTATSLRRIDIDLTSLEG